MIALVESGATEFMTQRANVSSIDALRSFKAALHKFIETADKALTEADSELVRVQDWIQHDRPLYWKGEIRRREQEVVRAKDELRRVLWTMGDHKPAAVEQKKALKLAERRLEEARQKVQATVRWRVQMDREANEYKGQVQLIASAVEVDLPRAASMLDNMAERLDEYVSFAPTGLDKETAADLEASPPKSMALPSVSRPRSRGNRDEPAPAELDEFASLRARCPGAKDRSDVVMTSSVSDFLASGEASTAVVPVLEALHLARAAPRPGDLVVYEDGAFLASTCFFCRDGESVKGDSGWYVGSAEQPADEARVLLGVTVSRLLGARPDLREVLSLPPGHLAVLRAGKIVAVLDASGVDLWGRRRGRAEGRSPGATDNSRASGGLT